MKSLLIARKGLTPSEYRRLKIIALHLDVTVGALCVLALREYLAECEGRVS